MNTVPARFDALNDRAMAGETPRGIARANHFVTTDHGLRPDMPPDTCARSGPIPRAGGAAGPARGGRRRW